MTRVCTVTLLATVLLAPGFPRGAEAASKYNACGLLTAAELKAAVNASVDKADDRDIVIPSGPYKGETMSGCSWVMGSTYADLSVIRGPQTAEQRAAGLSGMRRIETGLVKKGWSVEPAKIPGADCNAYKPPATESSMRPFASCIMQSKGLAFWLGVGGATSLTPQQVKALADKIAARLP
jgi:hypothetical protein